MKKKIMVWILSGIMVLQPIAGVQAAEFSDGVTGYFNGEENDIEENLTDDFYENEENIQFSDEQNGNVDGEEKIQGVDSATTDNMSDKCGDEVYWSYEDRTLTLTGSGNMYSFEEYLPPWRNLSSHIETVVIETGISNIGNYAFRPYYENLKTITLPDSIISIGKSAFSTCRGLETIILPDSVTSIGMNGFNCCSSLKTITLPNGITNIEDGTFEGCSSLKTIILPDSVTSIGMDAFSRCDNLETITLPDSVTSIGMNAFYGCRSLKTMILPNSVTDIESSTFRECRSLKTITLSNDLIEIGMYAFSKCNNLEIITLPDSVKSIGIYAFQGCNSLKAITLPHSMAALSIGMFDGCSNLKTVTLPDRIRGINMNTFRGCSSLETIILPDSVTYIDSEAFKDCFGLKMIALSNSVTSIKDSAFSGCGSLKDIYYSGSEAEWKKLGVTFDHDVAIHYNSAFTNKTFKLSVNQATILSNNNYIFVDYEAAVLGNVAVEEKQIKWSSSNPSIAEIKGTPVLIDSQDKNRGSGSIELSVYDVGEVTITGTAADGRTASVTINVEPNVFCKTFLHKIAKTFCRSLQLHFVGNCKPGWQGTCQSYKRALQTFFKYFTCLKADIT